VALVKPILVAIFCSIERFESEYGGGRPSSPPRHGKPDKGVPQ
jgi:hypothetical protein